MFFPTERHTPLLLSCRNIQVAVSTVDTKSTGEGGGVGMGRGRERGLDEETHGRSQCEVLYLCGEMGDGIRTLCSPELGGYLIRQAQGKPVCGMEWGYRSCKTLERAPCFILRH